MPPTLDGRGAGLQPAITGRSSGSRAAPSRAGRLQVRPTFQASPVPLDGRGAGLQPANTGRRTTTFQEPGRGDARPPPDLEIRSYFTPCPVWWRANKLWRFTAAASASSRTSNFVSVSSSLGLHPLQDVARKKFSQSGRLLAAEMNIAATPPFLVEPVLALFDELPLVADRDLRVAFDHF